MSMWADRGSGRLAGKISTTGGELADGIPTALALSGESRKTIVFATELFRARCTRRPSELDPWALTFAVQGYLAVREFDSAAALAAMRSPEEAVSRSLLQSPTAGFAPMPVM